MKTRVNVWPEVPFDMTTEKYVEFDVFVESTKDTVRMKVDFDDVDHAFVAAFVDVFKDFVEREWDENHDWKLRVTYAEYLKKQWDGDTWLREEFDDDFDKFLSTRLSR